MLAAVCLVALTSYESGMPVFINAPTLAYVETNTYSERTELRFGHNTSVYVRETTQAVSDKIVSECGPARDGGKE